MKKFILFYILFFHFYGAISQSNGNEIVKLEIYAVNYDNIFTMHPTIDKIKNFGLFVRTTDNSDIYDSNLPKNLNDLEKRKSTPYDSLEVIGGSRAVVEVNYGDGEKEYLYILNNAITWRNRRYKMYYPVLESVYSFYPDRFLNRRFNKEYYEKFDVD